MDKLIDDFPVLQHEQRRDIAHRKLSGQLLGFIHIYLADQRFPFKFGCHLIQNRQQLLRLPAPGYEKHDIASLQISACPMHGLCRRQEARRPFNAAHQMSEMPAGDSGMAAAGGADPG